MSTDIRSQEWYNANAEAYTAHVRDPDDGIYHSYYEKPAMYGLLPDLDGKSVISLGCGSGEDCHYLQAQGAARVTGIDLSDKLLDIARSSYPECEFKQMDMERLDFPDESFDLVYSSLAIHYIEDWQNVLQGVHRVLRPGGTFLFSCNHPVTTALKIVREDEFVKITELSRTRDRTSDNVSIVGDYVTRRAIEDEGNMLVTTYHKSFGDIASEIADAGFLISNICEPKPLEKMRSVSPHNYETLSKIPAFVIFKLLKPQK